MTDETSTDVEIAESSTASEAGHEPNAEQGEKPINQEAIQKRFDTLAAEKHEQRLRAEAAEERLKALEQQQAGQQEAQPQALKMPDDDLRFENPEEYQRQFIDFQKQVARQAVLDEQKALREAEAKTAKQQAELQRQTDLIQRGIKSASEHGLNFEEVDRSAAVLGQRGMNQEVADILLNHDAMAPLIDHLAKNPLVFDEVNNLRSPIDIVRKLDSLQPNAVQRNVSTAPEPIDTLSGLPAREADEFEKLCPNAKFI